MASNAHVMLLAEAAWQMPVRPESYDRSPLTEQERWALEQSVTHAGERAARSRFRSTSFRNAQRFLTRLNQPIADVFFLRHPSTAKNQVTARFAMHQAMHQYGKVFWEWSADQWVEVLSPNPEHFQEKHGKWQNMRTTIMDAAYLLWEVVDLRAAGITQEAVECAYVYFGRERVNAQCQRISSVLTGLGYGESQPSFGYLLHAVSLLFLLQRSPWLEDISEPLLEELIKESYPLRRQAMMRIRRALQYLKLLPQQV